MSENKGIEAPGTVHIPMQDVFDAYRAYVTTPLGEVHAERRRQDALFSEQNHPVLASKWAGMDKDFYYAQATAWKFENATRKEGGQLAWDGILLEEVFEALETDDPAKQREELIQVAAVALAAVESLDRAAARAADSDSVVAVDIFGNEEHIRTTE